MAELFVDRSQSRQLDLDETISIAAQFRHGNSKRLREIGMNVSAPDRGPIQDNRATSIEFHRFRCRLQSEPSNCRHRKYRPSQHLKRRRQEFIIPIVPLKMELCSFIVTTSSGGFQASKSIINGLRMESRLMKETAITQLRDRNALPTPNSSGTRIRVEFCHAANSVILALIRNDGRHMTGFHTVSGIAWDDDLEYFDRVLEELSGARRHISFRLTANRSEFEEWSRSDDYDSRWIWSRIRSR